MKNKIKTIPIHKYGEILINSYLAKKLYAEKEKKYNKRKIEFIQLINNG